MGNRGEKRGVRLDEEAVPRYLGEDLADVGRLREGHHPGDAEAVPGGHEGPRHLQPAGVGVEIADDAGELGTADDLHHGRVGLPVVHHHRQRRLDRDPQLLREDPLLHVAR